MNKLLTFDGGQPLKLDDFVFIQNSILETFSYLARWIYNGNFILSDCDLQGGLTPGVVVLNGEICVFDGVDTIDTNTAYFDIGLSYNAAGLKTFKNGIQHNTYQVRKAIISTSGIIKVAETPRMPDAFNAFHNFAIQISALYSMIPSPAFSVYSGNISDVPSGWALCDGNNGTPDLSSQFVAGQGNSYNLAYIKRL